MPDATVWTSIWCHENPGRGGFASIIETAPGKRGKGAYGRRLSTTNRFHILAALLALKHIEENELVQFAGTVLITSSSRYLVDGLDKTEERSQEGKKNNDLWRRLALHQRKYRLTAQWVKTQSIPEFREFLRLAQEAGNQEDLPPDTGYEEEMGITEENR